MYFVNKKGDAYIAIRYHDFILLFTLDKLSETNFNIYTSWFRFAIRADQVTTQIYLITKQSNQ